MATGSGLDAQIGVASETTWGTGVTPTRFVEFISETLTHQTTWVEPTGIRPTRKYKRGPRISKSRESVSGQVTVELATKGMGKLIAHMLASGVTATTQIDATAAYEQIHTPGDHRGKGLTIQVGRPEPGTGTVRPFTYNGCKISGWNINVTDNAVPSLGLTVDGQAEDTVTALATASYLSGSRVFSYRQATLKLGGTPTTASGETTIADGVALATVARTFSLSGTTPFATERFGIGTAGLKREQLENGTPTMMVNLGTEFAKTELYDVYKAADEPFPLQFTLTGDLIEGAHSFMFDVILPAVLIKTAPPQVGGPDIVQMGTELEVYDNEVDPPIQIKIVSDETTVV